MQLLPIGLINRLLFDPCGYKKGFIQALLVFDYGSQADWPVGAVIHSDITRMWRLKWIEELRVVFQVV